MSIPSNHSNFEISPISLRIQNPIKTMSIQSIYSIVYTPKRSHKQHIHVATFGIGNGNIWLYTPELWGSSIIDIRDQSNVWKGTNYNIWSPYNKVYFLAFHPPKWGHYIQRSFNVTNYFRSNSMLDCTYVAH